MLARDAALDLDPRPWTLQSDGVAFERPEGLLQRLGLLALTQQSFASCLKEQLGTDTGSLRFGAEFSAAVNRVNYNQGSRINALAGAGAVV